MKELGLPVARVISIASPPISMEHGAEAIVRLIEQAPDVEAAMCTSDLPAFGAIMECARRGWKVPERIAIAGFGDFEVASCSEPTITTVGVNCCEIGRQAGELMLRAIKGARGGTPFRPRDDHHGLRGDRPGERLTSLTTQVDRRPTQSANVFHRYNPPANCAISAAMLSSTSKSAKTIGVANNCAC